MRSSTNLLLSIVVMAASPLFGQASKPVLENDQVRVVVATDQPHVKGEPHKHDANRVMVYLTAGKQEIIKDGKSTVTEFKPGEVKWSPATGTHTSQVLSDSPLRIVEVEIKKPGDPAKKVTTALDPPKVDKQDYKVEFENDQVRVMRVKMAAKRQVPLHEHQLNRVVVYLTDHNGTSTVDGKTTTSEHKAGEVSWGGPMKHSESNLMDKPFEAVVVELKN